MIFSQSFRIGLFAAAALSGAAAYAQDAAPFDLGAAITALGATTCADSDSQCVTISVPVNHSQNDPDRTIDITFSVSLATEESKGIVFYAVGGPGGSGLMAVDGYLSAFAEDVTANLDFVFFDQRGIGPDHGFVCDATMVAYALSDFRLDQPDVAKAQARAFVDDCVAEFASQDITPFAGTDQAIQDIEMFRQALGAPQVWVYGESYGTQFAQAYATAYPGAISGVILDGVVDLTLTPSGFYSSYTAASELIMDRVLAECIDVPKCGTDMKGDATEVYDALNAILSAAPITVELPAADGATITRDLTAAMLEMNAFSSLYGPYGRAEFLRALAAASRGDMTFMLRLAYANMGLDLGTEAMIPDPTWFGAAYYAINCMDYTEPGADGDARADYVLADAATKVDSLPRFLRSAYVERLVCAYWPYQGPATRPAPFAGGDYPTFILNGDADPITPAVMSYSVFDNVKNGYLIMMEGGPHVIWGRGLACPDTIMEQVLLDGVMPQTREQVCRQSLISDYVPLTLTDMADAANPFLVAEAFETELYNSPTLYMWDAVEPMTMGCDHGGTLTVSPTDTGTDYAFDGCIWWPGIVIDGTGTDVANDEPGDAFTLDLTISGQHSGQILYVNDYWGDARRISGTYDGVEITTPRLPM